VPILFRRPQVVPLGPDAVRSQIDREQSVKVRKSFFGEQIQRERHPGRIADPPRPLSEGLQMIVRIFAGSGLEQFRWKPEYALGFVRGH